MDAPLLVAVVHRGNRADTEFYARVLRKTFLAAGEQTKVTSAPKELLQVTEFREYDYEDVAFLATLLRAATRTLLVVLDAVPQRVVAGTRTEAEERLLPILLDAGRPFSALNVLVGVTDSVFDTSRERNVVRLSLGDLDERDLRPSILSLQVLHRALGLFVDGSAGKPVRLFFSHAKRDGVPLTVAVLQWLKFLRGAEAFYDTQNLDLDGDIERQLEEAVRHAIVIVFRTDVFDQRHWCQKEVVWAEHYGRPLITVDARWQIEHGPSAVSFDSTPAVRIPDGNLARILVCALVEALRIELFLARARAHALGLRDASSEFIPRWPSLVSLHAALSTLASRDFRSFIVYPNPSMPAGISMAAQQLATSMHPGVLVVSLDQFRLAE